MKTKYILMLLVCLSTVLSAQNLKVTKTDGTMVSFKLADIDSVQISTTTSAKTISASDWNCVSTYSLAKVAIATGVFEDAVEGLKVYGNSSNNAVKLMPVSSSVISNKTIYLRWKANGSQVNVGVKLFENAEDLTPACNALSISTASGLIDAGIWYYTRIKISGGQAAVVTSKDNFDNNGGTVIASSFVPVTKEVKTYSFETTTSKTSYSVLSEARVE
jgi:hypothetical protein